MAMEADGEQRQWFFGLAGTSQDIPSSNHKDFKVKIACNIEYNNPHKRWNQLSDDTMPRKDHRYMQLFKEKLPTYNATDTNHKKLKLYNLLSFKQQETGRASSSTFV